MSCWSGVCVCLEKFRKTAQTCDLRACCVLRSEKWPSFRKFWRLVMTRRLARPGGVWEVHSLTGSLQPRLSPRVSLGRAWAEGTVRPRLIQADAKFMPISVHLDAKNITITHSHDSILEMFNLLVLNDFKKIVCLVWGFLLLTIYTKQALLA